MKKKKESTVPQREEKWLRYENVKRGYISEKETEAPALKCP